MSQDYQLAWPKEIPERGIYAIVCLEDQRVYIGQSRRIRTPEAAIEARSGATLSDEHKRKIGEANRGHKWTEDQRAALRGRVVSEEHKSAISKAMRGRPWSPARRAAHEAAKRRKARGG